MIKAMIAVLAFAALQGNAYLVFTPGETMVYRETFAITQEAGSKTYSADATRTQTLRVKEFRNGRGIMDAVFTDMTAKARDRESENLALNVRTWIDRENLEQWVNTRGFLERGGYPVGTRPFFGFNVPAHKDAIPEKWQLKLLAPIGVDKTFDHKYTVDSTARVPTIKFTGQYKDKDVTVNVNGKVTFGNGKVDTSEIHTEVVDRDSTLNVNYRADRQR
jgi:hypothetical protein